MRKLLPLLAVLAVAPLPALADGKIVLNARAGVAMPLGEIGDGAKLGDLVGWAFPLQADLQFRFAKHLSLGAYTRYAPATLESDVSNACDAAGVSCKVADIAFGLLGEYRFSDRMEGGPWIGANAGWEMLRSDTSASGGKSTTTVSGLELGVQVGSDFELGGLALGPWIGVSAGQFSKASTKIGGVKVSDDISDKALHAWLQLGLRASFVF